MEAKKFDPVCNDQKKEQKFKQKKNEE